MKQITDMKMSRFMIDHLNAWRFSPNQVANLWDKPQIFSYPIEERGEREEERDLLLTLPELKSCAEGVLKKWR